MLRQAQRTYLWYSPGACHGNCYRTQSKVDDIMIWPASFVRSSAGNCGGMCLLASRKRTLHVCLSPICNLSSILSPPCHRGYCSARNLYSYSRKITETKSEKKVWKANLKNGYHDPGTTELWVCCQYTMDILHSSKHIGHDRRVNKEDY